MSAEFVKLISDLYTERFNMHLQYLVMNQTPVGIFYGFELTPSYVAKDVQTLVQIGLNVTCVIVLADRQADALKNFVDLPVVALEDIDRLGEENFPVKPQEVFLTDDFLDYAFAPYFIHRNIELIFTVGQTETFLYCMKQLPELYAVHESFADDESKKVFRAVIKGYLTGRISDYRFASEAQYFLDEFLPTAGDIAIDGGAYDGATSIAFAKLGTKVFAFEMDATNYQNCVTRTERLGGGV